MVFVSMDPDINLEQKIKETEPQKRPEPFFTAEHTRENRTGGQQGLLGVTGDRPDMGHSGRYHINATSDGGVGPTSIRAAWEKKFQPGAREGELEFHL